MKNETVADEQRLLGPLAYICICIVRREPGGCSRAASQAPGAVAAIATGSIADGAAVAGLGPRRKKIGRAHV